MKDGYKYTWSEIEILKANWNSLSIENKGNFRSIKSSKYSLTRRFELEIPYSSLYILIQTDEFKPLKIKYIFPKQYNSNFLIYPEDFTDKIGKLFGLKEFETGIVKFDKKFFLKGNDKKLLFELLNLKVRNYLLNHYVSNFKLETIKDQSILELNIVINELDIHQMKELIELFKVCINIVDKNL